LLGRCPCSLPLIVGRLSRFKCINCVDVTNIFCLKRMKKLHRRATCIGTATQLEQKPVKNSYPVPSRGVRCVRVWCSSLISFWTAAV
jgi:hypothetical protein